MHASAKHVVIAERFSVLCWEHQTDLVSVQIIFQHGDQVCLNIYCAIRIPRLGGLFMSCPHGTSNMNYVSGKVDVSHLKPVKLACSGTSLGGSGEKHFPHALSLSNDAAHFHWCVA